MNPETPAPILAIEIGKHRPALFFNGQHWKELHEASAQEKKLLTAIETMPLSKEHEPVIYPTFRADFGHVGRYRVALLHQKTYQGTLNEALESSRLPQAIKNLWPGQENHTLGETNA